MKLITIVLLMLVGWVQSSAQLKVSADKRYLVHRNGKPFFWLGDTAWELFHRLNREEARQYLQNRAAKGFTVIQAVVLAELDGLNTPNTYGNKPLRNNDPLQPNEAYFKHVDFIVNEANKLGLVMAILPSWGDKWKKDKWGMGPEIFTESNARSFGTWIARRYARNNIVWVLGGDRHFDNEAQVNIIRSMAEGIRIGDPAHLLTFHPTGGRSSFEYFADADWIDFHMSQTGHRVASPDYAFNARALALPKLRPHVNGEPNYEDHPNDFRPVEKGWMDDFDTREAAWWNMLSGGAGHTYGNHNIWQMYTEKREPLNNARIRWQTAMDQPGARCVGYMRRMLEKRNWQRLRSNQGMIRSSNSEGAEYRVAALSEDADFAIVYIPYGQKTTLNLGGLKAPRLQGWWFNPRDGHCTSLGEFTNEGEREFVPTAVGRGSDWVLVVDDAAKKYPEPNAF